MPPGSKRCPRTCKTAPSQRRCRRSATLISLNSRQSSRRAALAATDPPASACPISFLLRLERGPFCTPIGGPFWMPIDTLSGYLHQETVPNMGVEQPAGPGPCPQQGVHRVLLILFSPHVWDGLM